MELPTSEIKSTLINLNPENLEISRLVQVVNVKPIILDMTRCGILEPIFYFVARDFGTCIGKVLLPNETDWSLAYLIQCDDSGLNDLDMVKVCLVKIDRDHDNENDNEIPSLELEPTPLAANLPFKAQTLVNSKNDENLILENSNFPVCQSISTLLYNLKRYPKEHDIVFELISVNFIFILFIYLFIHLLLIYFKFRQLKF